MRLWLLDSITGVSLLHDSWHLMPPVVAVSFLFSICKSLSTSLTLFLFFAHIPDHLLGLFGILYQSFSLLPCGVKQQLHIIHQTPQECTISMHIQTRKQYLGALEVFKALTSLSHIFFFFFRKLYFILYLFWDFLFVCLFCFSFFYTIISDKASEML